MLFFVLSFMSITMVKIFSTMFIYIHTHTHTHMTSKLYGISLSIRKLQKNTLLYPIIGRTKTRKLVLTIMKIKYNALVLRDHIIQFFTRRYWRCNIPFNSTYKKSFLFFFFLEFFCHLDLVLKVSSTIEHLLVLTTIFVGVI
jgi:hypothetical protein